MMTMKSRPTVAAPGEKSAAALGSAAVHDAIAFVGQAEIVGANGSLRYEHAKGKKQAACWPLSLRVSPSRSLVLKGDH